MDRLAARAAKMNWQRAIIIWIGVIQAAYMLALLWLPERGLSGLIERDFHTSHEVFVVLFAFGAGVFLRSLTPRPTLLVGLSGQTIYSVAALYYTMQGRFNLVGLVGHAGLCLLSWLLILIAYQDSMQTVPRFNARRYLTPAAGIILLTYALGIVSQPEQGMIGFLTATFAMPGAVLLALFFAVAAGCLFDNAAAPFVLFWAGVPQSLLTGVALIYWTSTPGIPVAGILSHLLLCVLMILVTIAQMQDRDAWTS